jgi:hypothetical protein
MAFRKSPTFSPFNVMTTHPPDGYNHVMAKEIVYQIKLEGELDARWSAWFNSLSVCVGEEITTLTGPVADQAALRGILNKIWDLNLTLVSVVRLEGTEAMK